MDFRKQDYGKRGIMVESDNVYMKGLTIRYTGKNGLFNIGSYCIFENLDVYGNGDTGIQMKNGHSNLILNCDSHDNFDYKLKGIEAADFGGNADGFADKQYYGGGNTYRGCRAWNNSDDGWDFYAHSTAYYGGTVIEDCICYGNGPEEYDMRKHARYETDKEWFDQFKGDGIDITDNDGQPGHVSLRHYTNYGNGNGFKLGGKRTVHNVTVKNCISVKNRVKGFDQNNNLGSMCMYNNTGYQNGENFGFHNKENGGKLAIRNSISINGQRNDVLKTATTVHTNNTWDTEGIQATEADFKSVDYQKYILIKRQPDGSLRQLHIEDALNVIETVDPSEIEYKSYDDVIAECRFFKVRVIENPEDEVIDVNEESFLHIMCVEGSVSVSDEGGSAVVNKGGSLFVPASNGKTTMTGKGKIVVTTL
jgi:hypothetical protein